MTDCDRLLAVLQDGRPHSHSELYGLGMIVHSRVADLRAKGHNITCTKQRDYVDHGRPHFSYWYQLVGSLDAAEGEGLAAAFPAGEALIRSPASRLSAASNEPTLEEYGIARAVRELNAEFPGMLIPARDAMLSLDENRKRLAELQANLFGDRQAA